MFYFFCLQLFATLTFFILKFCFKIFFFQIFYLKIFWWTLLDPKFLLVQKIWTMTFLSKNYRSRNILVQILRSIFVKNFFIQFFFSFIFFLKALFRSVLRQFLFHRRTRWGDITWGYMALGSRNSRTGHTSSTCKVIARMEHDQIKIDRTELKHIRWSLRGVGSLCLARQAWRCTIKHICTGRRRWRRLFTRQDYIICCTVRTYVLPWTWTVSPTQG